MALILVNLLHISDHLAGRLCIPEQQQAVCVPQDWLNPNPASQTSETDGRYRSAMNLQDLEIHLFFDDTCSPSCRISALHLRLGSCTEDCHRFWCMGVAHIGRIHW